MKTRELQEGMEESYRQLRQFFRYSNEKLLEISMKLDQHILLSYNWVKGYIDERCDKFVSAVKAEAKQEDDLVQARVDASQQDLMVKQTQIKYNDILARLLGESQGSILDLEYIMFPDLLAKFIECQTWVINDRVRNVKTMASFLSEMCGHLEGLQKGTLKIVKTSMGQVQDKAQQGEVFCKKLVMIEEILLGWYEAHSKKIS